ncbi:pleiotropic regulator 1, partial [Saccoglossus kowalevskii]|uniref:Pleiotropic regulator 1 n=1 Tax=Saccoglossus kowalevskii TaxID=10224 RepID=A0ABM0GNL4_SACKO
MEEVQKHSVHTLVFRSLKRSHDMFVSDNVDPPPAYEEAEKLKMACKARDEYGPVMHLPIPKEVNKITHARTHAPIREHPGEEMSARVAPGHPYAPTIETGIQEVMGSLPASQAQIARERTAASVEEIRQQAERLAQGSRALVAVSGPKTSNALVPLKAPTLPKPQWHPPWKLYRVISGHIGWVRCVAVEPGNEWFCTGSADRTIKIWDLASGKLKLSLTGHVSTVRGLAVSKRQPYLFSGGEDKQVKCWDLEQNKVIRHYHGHLSAVYGLDIHPTIDVLVTCSRDASVRVWDMRTKACVHTLTGHTNTVADVKCQASEPQIISGSHDCTVRLWDLAAGKTRCTLTNHKKSIRSLVIHPKLYMFASASPDNIKQWKCPDGSFLQNLSGHNSIVNCLSMNTDGVMVSGGDNGSMYFWDWKTGYNFQRIQTATQPGSLDSEAGIFASTFDHSSSRLITVEADKTIKIYKEDDNA